MEQRQSISSTNAAGITRHSHSKNESKHRPYIIRKKWTQNEYWLNVKFETIKLLEENLDYFGYGDAFSDIILPKKSMKEKFDKPDFTKIENCCSMNVCQQNEKISQRLGEKYF